MGRKKEETEGKGGLPCALAGRRVQRVGNLNGAMNGSIEKIVDFF